jgi:magnesium transporter
MSLKIIHTKNLRWVDIINPDDTDLIYLKDNFKFHPLDIEDVVTPAVRIKIDEYEHYYFIVLLFPFIHKETNEIHPAEVDFFVGKDYVITIHDGKMKTLTNLVSNVHQYDQTRALYMSSGPGLLLFSILELLFKRSSPILDRINHSVTTSGHEVFQLDINTLEKLSELKKNIIVYRRIMKMHRFVLGKLAQSKREYMHFKDSKAFFQNLIEYAENIWDMLASDKESVESFEETNQSLATHKINDILQLLTVLSVVVSIVTMVTDILILFERTNLEKTFGIGSDKEFTLIVTSLLIFVVTGTLIYFKRKKIVNF